jgi:hypothetical protein
MNWLFSKICGGLWKKLYQYNEKREAEEIIKTAHDLMMTHSSWTDNEAINQAILEVKMHRPSEWRW